MGWLVGLYQWVLQQNLPRLNMLIASAVFGLNFLLICIRGITKNSTTPWPGFLDFHKLAATSRAFVYWTAWWMTIAITYVVDPRPDVRLFINNFGDVLLIMMGIIYLRGNKGGWSPPRAGEFFGVLGVLFFIQGAIIAIYKTRDSTAWAIMAVSPSVVLSNVAILLFGWALFVRWVLRALLVGAIALSYSIAQAPAHLYFYIVDSKAVNEKNEPVGLIQALESIEKKLSNYAADVATLAAGSNKTQDLCTQIEAVETKLSKLEKQPDLQKKFPSTTRIMSTITTQDLPKIRAGLDHASALVDSCHAGLSRMGAVKDPDVKKIHNLANLSKIFLALVVGKVALALFCYPLFFGSRAPSATDETDSGVPPNMDNHQIWPRDTPPLSFDLQIFILQILRRKFGAGSNEKG